MRKTVSRIITILGVLLTIILFRNEYYFWVWVSLFLTAIMAVNAAVPYVITYTMVACIFLFRYFAFVGPLIAMAILLIINMIIELISFIRLLSLPEFWKASHRRRQEMICQADLLHQMVRLFHKLFVKTNSTASQ